MKAKTIFITIRFGGGKPYDYPQNIPLPRVGEFVVFTPELNLVAHYGKVREIRHIITQDLTDIKILADY